MKKIKKNQLIITALAIMIAAAGYINYTGNLSDIITVNDTVSTQDPTSNPVDEVSGDILSNDAEPDEQSLQEPGSVVLTSGNGVSSSVVSEAKLNREQIRAKNKETLLEVINNAALTESAKAEAVAQLSAITDNSEKEIAAELLLEAKGFSDAAVSILDGNVDVVINQTQLTDTQKAQIEDIVKRKTGIAAENIVITPLKQSEEDSLDTASASGTEDYEEEDSGDSLNTASEEVQDETSYEDTSAYSEDSSADAEITDTETTDTQTSAQPYEDSVTDTTDIYD